MRTYFRLNRSGDDPQRLLDPDFDADEGALLVHPTRIVDTRPLDEERIRALAACR